MRGLVFLQLASLGGLLAQTPVALVPVAYVKEAGDSKLLRRGARYAITLTRGELLYPGDRITTQGLQSSTTYHCPAKESVRVSQGGSFQVDADRVQDVEGPSSARSAIPFCQLPRISQEVWNQPRHESLLDRNAAVPTSTASAGEIRSRLPAGRESLLQELQLVESAIQRDPLDEFARISKGSILEQIGLTAAAIPEYQAVQTALGGADVRFKEIVHRLSATTVLASRPQRQAGAPTGRTFAVLTGISNYGRKQMELRYADRDAVALHQFFRSDRGGNVPAENLTLLLNGGATMSRIREGIKRTLMESARPGDTIVFFFSAHGDTEKGTPYLVPIDANPDNLHDTGIEMGMIGKLLEFGVGKGCRVLILLDVCRAGSAMGQINGKDVGYRPDSEVLVLLATEPTKPAVESIQFGGGHSVFTYFLLKGLNGEADEDSDGRIDTTELVDYVKKSVRKATGNCQKPNEYQPTDSFTVIPNLRLAGISLGGWTPLSGCIPQQRADMSLTASAEPLRTKSLQQPDSVAEREFLESLQADPFDEETAFIKLAALRQLLPQTDERYRSYEDQLRTLFQDRGQQVILRYLEGEARPQLRSNFAEGERFYRAALRMDPNAPALLGRLYFCVGRLLVFDKQYPAAIAELEQAARFDPKGPYVYNALGIAYFEQANFKKAITAFEEAQRLAPKWLYPRHNLALALTEDGQFDRSRAVLQAAMKQSPDLAYLPYTLGLLEVRLNRRSEAVRLFRKTTQLAPGEAFGYNGLAYAFAAQNQTRRAEEFYRVALAREPGSVEVKHNLALLLARIHRGSEAETLWKSALLTAPDFAPALSGLSEFYANQGEWSGLIPLSRALLGLQHDYHPASILLARALVKTGEAAAALSVLAQVPPSAETHLVQGDAFRSLGQESKALESYRAAVKYSTVKSPIRREIAAKLKARWF